MANRNYSSLSHLISNLELDFRNVLTCINISCLIMIIGDESYIEENRDIIIIYYQIYEDYTPQY